LFWFRLRRSLASERLNEFKWERKDVMPVVMIVVLIVT